MSPPDPLRPLASTDSPARGYRLQRCDGCGLVPELCVCARWHPISSPIHFTAVLHAAEVGKPTNTARLVQLWLAGTALLVKGTIADRQGTELRRRLEQLPAQTAILFPNEDAVPIAELDPAGRPQHLLIPDGTWTQARRIVKRDLLPLGLPVVRLPEGLPSAYNLRRHSRGSICTLEATAHALIALGDPRGGNTLLERFAHWAALATAVRKNTRPSVKEDIRHVAERGPTD